MKKIMCEGQIDINVDGKQVKSYFYESNGYMMVPALFFKYTGTLVDYDRMQQSITLKRNNTIITFYKDKYGILIEEEKQIKYETYVITPLELDGNILIPFQYAIQKLGMSFFTCSTTNRLNVVTNHFPEHKVVVFKRGPANKKMVALTFDDGPDSIYTPKVLDILKEKKVHATFFVIGQQVRFLPEMFKRIISEGHEIGNHSWSHPNFEKLTTSELKKELDLTDAEMRSHIGKSTSLLRPPYGLVTKSDLQIINDLGYKVIMWSVDTLDWSGLTEEEIISIVNRDLTEGAIILQHCYQSLAGRLDGSVKALPVIIEKFLNEGYEIVTISKLLDSCLH